MSDEAKQKSEHWVLGLRTRPMTLSELSRWFDLSSRRMADHMSKLAGVEKWGNRFRVPVREMPPEYIQELKADTERDDSGHG